MDKTCMKHRNKTALWPVWHKAWWWCLAVGLEITSDGKVISVSLLILSDHSCSQTYVDLG